MSSLNSDIPKRRSLSFNLLKKFWFILMIVIIIIIFIINKDIGIWTAIVASIVFLFYNIPSFSFKNRLIQFMKKYPTIDDKLIAKEFARSLEEITTIMLKISTKQKRSKFLIIFLNKRCIFYHERIVNEFIKLYHKGLSEKEIFENLVQKVNIRTRAEIKAMENTLISQNRLIKRNDVEKEINEPNFKSTL